MVNRILQPRKNKQTLVFLPVPTIEGWQGWSPAREDGTKRKWPETWAKLIGTYFSHDASNWSRTWRPGEGKLGALSSRGFC